MDHIAGRKPFLKLVHPGGIIETHYQPITAGEVMKNHPRHYVTRPDIFKNPSLVVRPESILQPGNKFYVVPEYTLRRLLQTEGSQNQKQPNGDGKLNERCRVKPRDRRSFRHQDSKVVDDPDENFYEQSYASCSSAEMPHRTAKFKGNLKTVHPISRQTETKTSIKGSSIRNIDGKPYNKSGLAKKHERESDTPEKPHLVLPILDQLSDSSASSSDCPIESSRDETKFSCIVKRRTQVCRNRESCKLSEAENIPPAYALGCHSEEVLSREQDYSQSTHEKSSFNSTSFTTTVTENDGLDTQHPSHTTLSRSTEYADKYAVIPYQPSPEMNNFLCIVRRPSKNRKNNHETKLKDKPAKFVESKHSLVNHSKALSSKKQYVDLTVCSKPTLNSPHQVQDIDGNELQYDAWERNLNHIPPMRVDAKSQYHSPENDHEAMRSEENVVRLKSCLRKDKSHSRGLRVRFTLPGEDEDNLRVEVFEYEDLGGPQSFDNCSLAPKFFDVSSHLRTPGNVTRQ